MMYDRSYRDLDKFDPMRMDKVAQKRLKNVWWLNVISVMLIHWLCLSFSARPAKLSPSGCDAKFVKKYKIGPDCKIVNKSWKLMRKLVFIFFAICKSKKMQGLWKRSIHGLCLRCFEKVEKCKVCETKRSISGLCLWSWIICKSRKMQGLWKRSIYGLCLPACATSPTTRPR